MREDASGTAGTTRERTGRRAWLLCVAGVGLGLAAPIGWVLVRSWYGTPARLELATQWPLLFYMVLAAVLPFGVFGWWVGHHEDRLVEMNQDLARWAMTDALTGVHNRRYLFDRAKEEVARAARSNRPVCLALVDVDDFKRINDTFGHPVGDRVLQLVAMALRSVTRQMDTVARVGGDEFAVLMPDTDAVTGRAVARRIRRAVDALTEQIRHADQRTVTVSVGIAAARRPKTIEFSRLYEAADRALYRAKRDPRGVRATTADRPPPALRPTEVAPRFVALPR